jgi:hypothetical protein
MQKFNKAAVLRRMQETPMSGFAGEISAALEIADSGNTRRLVAAFPEIFTGEKPPALSDAAKEFAVSQFICKPGGFKHYTALFDSMDGTRSFFNRNQITIWRPFENEKGDWLQNEIRKMANAVMEFGRELQGFTVPVDKEDQVQLPVTYERDRKAIFDAIKLHSLHNIIIRIEIDAGEVSDDPADFYVFARTVPHGDEVTIDQQLFLPSRAESYPLGDAVPIAVGDIIPFLKDKCQSIEGLKSGKICIAFDIADTGHTEVEVLILSTEDNPHRTIYSAML